jgi:hypothetical protein
MPGQGAALGVLDLQDDILINILARLEFNQRLLLPFVCRRLRELTAGPSELWREVKAQPGPNLDPTQKQQILNSWLR